MLASRDAQQARWKQLQSQTWMEAGSWTQLQSQALSRHAEHVAPACAHRQATLRTWLPTGSYRPLQSAFVPMQDFNAERGLGAVRPLSCCVLCKAWPLRVRTQADEARHEAAYTAIMAELFARDPAGSVLAFANMMKKARRHATAPTIGCKCRQ